MPTKTEGQEEQTRKKGILKKSLKMRGRSAKNSNLVDNQIDEVEKDEEIPEKWYRTTQSGNVLGRVRI